MLRLLKLVLMVLIMEENVGNMVAQTRLSPLMSTLFANFQTAKTLCVGAAENLPCLSKSALFIIVYLHWLKVLGISDLLTSLMPTTSLTSILPTTLQMPSWKSLSMVLFR